MQMLRQPGLQNETMSQILTLQKRDAQLGDEYGWIEDSVQSETSQAQDHTLWLKSDEGSNTAQL